MGRLHSEGKMFVLITSSIFPETGPPSSTCYNHSALLTASALLTFYLTCRLNISHDSWEPKSLPCHFSCYKLFLLSGASFFFLSSRLPTYSCHHQSLNNFYPAFMALPRKYLVCDHLPPEPSFVTSPAFPKLSC